MVMSDDVFVCRRRAAARGASTGRTEATGLAIARLGVELAVANA